LMAFPGLLAAAGLFLPSMWTTAICKNDEKNNTRRFTKTLPLGRNAYIASKYIFVGIAIYVLFSLENIWIIIFNSCAGSNVSSEFMMVLSGFVVEFCGISIILAAIELPFFITLGVKKGEMIKTGIMEGLGILVIVYMLFGNLEIFRNFNIVVIADWFREHSALVMLLSIISPVADLFIYWLSYRITCTVNRNREVEIDG
ncbi:MAG: ABC-2 transporter permease, partial [Acetatifactor sp.]|nr:ABC-2 transporter permease [Acetatifactor sp.]